MFVLDIEKEPYLFCIFLKRHSQHKQLNYVPPAPESICSCSILNVPDWADDGSGPSSISSGGGGGKSKILYENRIEHCTKNEFLD